MDPFSRHVQKLLAVDMYGGPLERLLHIARPTCRRCGRLVQRVTTSAMADSSGVRVEFRCHQASAELRIGSREAARIREVWPSHVFDYEAANFGSWDANGAPV